MVSKVQMDTMGGILFGMVCQVMADAKAPMKYYDWNQVDEFTKKNYMGIVERLVEVMGDVSIEPEKPTLVEELVEAHREPDSSLEASILAANPDVNLAQKVPERNPLQCGCGRICGSEAGLKSHQRSCKELVPA